MFARIIDSQGPRSRARCEWKHRDRSCCDERPFHNESGGDKSDEGWWRLNNKWGRGRKTLGRTTIAPGKQPWSEPPWETPERMQARTKNPRAGWRLTRIWHKRLKVEWRPGGEICRRYCTDEKRKKNRSPTTRTWRGTITMRPQVAET